MVWTEKSVVEQRLEFVMLASLKGANVSKLCERFGISRKTAYKWLGRFDPQQPEGSLTDSSKRPRTSPQRCEAALEAQVVELRKQHPAWGGRKIAHVLAREQGLQLAASTVTSILHRHQLIDSSASDAATPWQRFEHVAPNNLWQMDFKGHFALARGRCHPLTVLDDHSRYNIVLQACSNEQGATVQAALREVFRRYGLPARINTDNGQPWGDSASTSLAWAPGWCAWASGCRTAPPCIRRPMARMSAFTARSRQKCSEVTALPTSMNASKPLSNGARSTTRADLMRPCR